MGSIAPDSVPPIRVCRHCGSGPLVWHRVGVRHPMQLTYRGRGLCHLSYQRVLRAGGLADYAPVKRGYAVLWEDWCELEEQGYTRARAAERLGITHRHLQRVIARYRESVPA